MTVEQTQLTREQEELLNDLAAQWRENLPARAFTGAGISTESGIPDFRGPSGLWKKSKPTSFREFLQDPDLQRQYWERRRYRYPELQSKEPNEGHQALARLQHAGLLDEIITQNIDGLHQKAGTLPNRIIEIHGSSHQIRCLDCRRVFPASSADLDLDAELPVCPICSGLLKEATISFGEGLVEQDLRRSLALAESSQLMLVVGSSLTVNPAARIPRVAQRSGATVAIINNEPTSLDSKADFVIPAPAGAALRYLTQLLIPEQ